MSPNRAPRRDSKPDVNYALYLVTDSSEAILGKKNLVEVVEKAIRGGWLLISLLRVSLIVLGVSIVQYREKKLETRAMLNMAVRLRELCHRYGVKFIVNDRVDVALIAGADGVHLGQNDMKIQDARKILGELAIIGISCSTVDEALRAIGNGADYLGIGAVYATST